MAFNKSELILDKVRSLVAYDLEDGKMLLRLTSLEDPTLSCTAEGEEVTDAIGAVITTLYRAKKATFSATNSLLSLDLAAAQYGTEKEIGAADKMIEVPTYEILKIENGTVKLAANKEDVTVDANSVKYIYSIVNNDIGTGYVAGTDASETQFVISEDGTITVPTGLTGKVYVEYVYKTANAVRVRNMASNFPSACKLNIYAYFRDKCNENLLYSGVIICPKAKLNPEQIELALTSTGKHPFEFVMMKDYCAEEGADELFAIVVAE